MKQRGANDESNHSICEAAVATRDGTQSLATVSNAVGKTGDAVKQLRGAAPSRSCIAELLLTAVNRFLVVIRTVWNRANAPRADATDALLVRAAVRAAPPNATTTGPSRHHTRTGVSHYGRSVCARMHPALRHCIPMASCFSCSRPGMPSMLANLCPACRTEIVDDALSCVRCGAEVNTENVSGRAMLVLPGSPALSADLHRQTRSRVPIIGAGVLTVVIAAIGLWIMPNAATDESTVPVTAPVSTAPSARIATSPPAQLPAVTTVAASTIVIPATAVPTITAPPNAGPAIAAPAFAVPTIAAPSIAAPTIMSPTTPRTFDRADLRVRAALASASRGSALQVAPLVSHSLRMGERLRLRWSLRPPSGRRTPQRVAFTSADATIASVDSRTGIVTARAPGRARIIVDAGAAGMKVVTLEVRLPAAFPLVTIPPLVGIDAASATAIMPRVSTRLQWATSSDLAQAAESQSARLGVLRRDSASARAATGVAVPSAAASRSAAPGVSSATDAPRGALPTFTDVRTAAEQLAGTMQRGGMRNAEVMQFLDDGAEHRVTLVSTPVITSFSAYGVRVSFDLRLTKYVGGGRSVTRIVPVAMDVDKRDSALKTSAVVIGAVRRP